MHDQYLKCMYMNVRYVLNGGLPSDESHVDVETFMNLYNEIFPENIDRF